jgi:hypothetical protein
MQTQVNKQTTDYTVKILRHPDSSGNDRITSQTAAAPLDCTVINMVVLEKPEPIVKRKNGTSSV